MKRIISIALLLALLTTACAAPAATQPSTTTTPPAADTPVPETSDEPVSLEATPEPASQSIGADEGFFDVTITLPASMFEGSTEAEVVAAAKEQGITAALNEDGSYAYTMSKSKYAEFIAEMRATTKQSLDTIATGGDYPSVSAIDYNDNFSTVKITADKAAFEDSFVDQMSVFAAGIGALMYQAFDVDAPGRVTVTVEDAETHEVFREVVYPDAMEQ